MLRSNNLHSKLVFMNNRRFSHVQWKIPQHSLIDSQSWIECDFIFTYYLYLINFWFITDSIGAVPSTDCNANNLPNLYKGSHSSGLASTVPVGTTITYTCDQGRRLASRPGDTQFVTCKNDGSFTALESEFCIGKLLLCVTYLGSKRQGGKWNQAEALWQEIYSN